MRSLGLQVSLTESQRWHVLLCVRQDHSCNWDLGQVRRKQTVTVFLFHKSLQDGEHQRREPHFCRCYPWASLAQDVKRWGRRMPCRGVHPFYLLLKRSAKTSRCPCLGCVVPADMSAFSLKTYSNQLWLQHLRHD